MDKYLDQRIFKTKQGLYSALFELLKSSTNIKVLDICKKANITPMTFYHHYGDKTQLIEDAIKDQLSLRLPIPVKLKPNNTKQLVYYLIHFLSEFFNNNKDLLMGIFNETFLKIMKNNYLYLFIKIVTFYINKELRQIQKTFAPITINIWSEILSYGLIGLFINRLVLKKANDFETIKNNWNLFINNYQSQTDI